MPANKLPEAADMLAGRSAAALLRRAAAPVRAFIRRHPSMRRFLLDHMPLVRPIARALGGGSGISPAEYQAWIALHDTLSEADRAAIRAHVANFRRRPVISVVMPVYDPPEAFLRAAIDSVRRQLYPHWELCIADDASPSPRVARVLAEHAGDPRIRTIRRGVNGHISAATNTALALATGEFVALMDHDDLLPEHALYEVAAAIEARPDLDVIYSDEDKVDGQGQRFDPYFKPDFDPDLLLGHNVVSHLGVYRRSLVERLGGMREGLEGSQDYDLALRATAASPDRVHHIPAVLYHWRQQAEGRASFSEASLQRCVAAARRAIGDHLVATGRAQARVTNAICPRNWNRVLWPLPDPPPMASIILMACGDAGQSARCAEGILARTDYALLELLIVESDDRSGVAPPALSRLEADPRVRILRVPGLRNRSVLCNRAARAAKGSILVLLQGDVEVAERGWLREMISQAIRPGIGAVGPKLRRAGAGAMQPAAGPDAVLFRIRSIAAIEAMGPIADLTLVRRVPAVSGVCLAVRRDLHEAVGGFDEANLPMALNDIDFCLRLGERGHASLWTPYAELWQRAAAFRDDTPEAERHASLECEIDHMRRRWRSLLAADTPYNPNLARGDGRFTLASPPRRQRPWAFHLEPA